MGFDINKRRLLRFGFDNLKSWENFNSVCQKQSNGECPVVCYIHALTMPYCPWCQRMPRSVRRVRRILTYRRGAFGVARFDRQGNSQEPQIVKRATVYGLHVLNRNTKHNTLIVIYKTMRILWIDTIKFPLFFISPNVIFYSCMWFLIGKWENNWVADVENVFFMSNVQISWKFIIYWIPRCLYTWKNIKISKAVWLIRLLQVVLPPP